MIHGRVLGYRDDHGVGAGLTSVVPGVADGSLDDPSVDNGNKNGARRQRISCEGLRRIRAYRDGHIDGLTFGVNTVHGEQIITDWQRHIAFCLVT